MKVAPPPTSSPTLLQAAPAALHQGQGRPAPYGSYEGLIADLSTSAWDGRGLFSRRRLERKAWLYLGAFSETAMCGFAIVDAGLLATAFIYVYDRERRLLVEEKLSLPLGFAQDFAPDPRQPWALSGRGRHWQYQANSDGACASFRGQRLQARLQLHGQGRGLTALAASPGRPFAHTYKAAALPVQMELELDGRRLSAQGGGMLDFTLGYPPRHTTWNWASLDGRTEDGRHIALNLVAHFMNGQENALWLGDQLMPLAQAIFSYATDDLLAPWQLRTQDGRVDIRFYPEGARRENLDLGLAASVFAQPFGRFEGYIDDGQGRQRVSGLGVVEQHRASW